MTSIAEELEIVNFTVLSQVFWWRKEFIVYNFLLWLWHNHHLYCDKTKQKQIIFKATIIQDFCYPKLFPVYACVFLNNLMIFNVYDLYLMCEVHQSVSVCLHSSFIFASQYKHICQMRLSWQLISSRWQLNLFKVRMLKM